ncbi:zinc finger MYND domain-containing protein 12 isoform X1 [Pseudopipra pipra]|uniref:zinc finger MYND domain-containing protein 12 isoform X1 n=1 Tax=Pseudopipra pipra TaxID=415032 RepID=UPI003139ED6D
MAGRPRCELCGTRPAPRLCPRCRLVRYCDASHQGADWNSIHEKICPLLIPPQPCFHSEREREHGKEQLLRRQKSIVEVAVSAAQRFLWEGKALEALPAALQALRFSARVFGWSSVQLVPVYLLLAEASTGTGNLRQASKYLSEAEWIVLQSPDCPAALQSRLHRGLGLFCIAQGNLDQALYHLATDVYLATSAFGVDSIEVSGGYFHMANIFFRQNKVDVANSLYTEVTRLWHSWLLSSLQEHQGRLRRLRARAEAAPWADDEEVAEDGMTEAQGEEARRVLQALLGVRKKQQLPEETARVLHALAMLHYLGLDLEKAREVGMKAFDLAKELPQQESLETIGHLLELINANFSHTK